jgi:tetratricopeptide (TPR) repeat protein
MTAPLDMSPMAPAPAPSGGPSAALDGRAARGPSALAFVGGMLLGLASAVGTIRWLERGPRPAEVPEDLGYLPSPAVARRLALGYENLAADLMWIRSVQYFGKHIETDRKFPQLRALLEVTVGLDPHFVEAYRYGAEFLWLAPETAAAVRYLEEGHQQNPDRWELPHDLGRLYFLQLGDDAKALHWWSIAQRLPDAPAYLPRFIARLEAKVGNLDTSLELWEAIARDPNSSEHFRKIAEQEIERLRAQLVQDRRPR